MPTTSRIRKKAAKNYSEKTDPQITETEKTIRRLKP
jgi:hypothetical protein